MNANAIINIAKIELGLDEDTYRALLGRVTGVQSLRAMDTRQKEHVIAEMKRLGFRVRARAAANSRPVAPRGDLRLCHVLWRLLAEADAVRRPGRAGLNAFVRARFESVWEVVPIDIDALREPAQIDAVVQALKDMCRRAGIAIEGGYRR